MIVDDEITVRNGLKNSFNWRDMDINIVADAADGEEALQKYEEYKPDIIITDICMSNINGLELISELKSKNNDVEFVILSGYSDFEYAKKALENNVFTYLLKPVRSQDLMDTMTKLKNKIYEKRKMHESAAEYTKAQKERFLNVLLGIKYLSDEKIKVLSDKYNITLPSDRYFVAVAQVDNSNEINEFNSYDMLSDIIYSHFKAKHEIWLCQTAKPNITVIVFCSSLNSENCAYKILSDIKRTFSKKCGFSLTIGVSSVFNSITSIDTANLQAQFAAQQKAFLGYDCIIHYNQADKVSVKDIITASMFLTSDEVDSILSGIKTLNHDLIVKALNQYFDRLYKLKNADVSIIKNNICELALLIIRTSAKNVELMEKIFNRIPQPLAEIQRLELIYELRAYIDDLIKCIFSRPEIYISNKYSRLVNQTISYIMLNYHLPITIDLITKKLHTSRTPLLRLFKRETGKTFNDFLREYRIKIAEDLIKSGNYKIYEVSSRVGYQDVKYFSKIFKKITGYSPSDYPKIKE